VVRRRTCGMAAASVERYHAAFAADDGIGASVQLALIDSGSLTGVLKQLNRPVDTLA
jgi:hypothetical protein